MGLMGGLVEGYIAHKVRHAAEQRESDKARTAQLQQVLNDPNLRPEDRDKIQSKLNEINRIVGSGRGARKARAKSLGEAEALEKPRAVTKQEYTGPAVDPETHTVGGAQARARTVTQPVTHQESIYYSPEEQAGQRAQAVAKETEARMTAEEPYRQKARAEAFAEKKELADRATESRLRVIREQGKLSLARLHENAAIAAEKETLTMEQLIARTTGHVDAEGRPAPTMEDKEIAAERVLAKYTAMAAEKDALVAEHKARTAEIVERTKEMPTRLAAYEQSLIQRGEQANARNKISAAKLLVQNEAAEQAKLAGDIMKSQEFITTNVGNPAAAAAVEEAKKAIRDNTAEFYRLKGVMDAKLSAAGVPDIATAAVTTAPRSTAVAKGASAADQRQAEHGERTMSMTEVRKFAAAHKVTEEKAKQHYIDTAKQHGFTVRFVE